MKKLNEYKYMIFLTSFLIYFVETTSEVSLLSYVIAFAILQLLFIFVDFKYSFKKSKLIICIITFIISQVLFIETYSLVDSIEINRDSLLLTGNLMEIMQALLFPISIMIILINTYSNIRAEVTYEKNVQ